MVQFGVGDGGKATLKIYGAIVQFATWSLYTTTQQRMASSESKSPELISSVNGAIATLSLASQEVTRNMHSALSFAKFADEFGLANTRKKTPSEA